MRETQHNFRETIILSAKNENKIQRKGSKTVEEVGWELKNPHANKRVKKCLKTITGNDKSWIQKCK